MDDHIERLDLMREDKGMTWDLSDNDRTAIGWAVTRIRELQSRPCPHVVSSDEGTQYCSLGEVRVKELEAHLSLANNEIDGQRMRAELVEAELAKRPKIDGLVSYVRLAEEKMRADRLEAENAMLVADNDASAKVCKDLEAENARLREAIEVALDWSENQEDTQMCETILREALEPTNG